MNDPLKIAKTLSQRLNQMQFDVPYVYNPLDYAWLAHAQYLKQYGLNTKKVLFLGMNPGPWGMAQTGVPFGEVKAVKDWLGIDAVVGAPKKVCPQKPIQGLECTRSEVSGKRFWGLMQKHFAQPQHFFKKFMVLNYCPLLFLESSGRNLTPDKLNVHDRKRITEMCDEALIQFINYYKPERVVGVGGFAKKCFERVLQKQTVPIESILHPSPASPVANRGWEEQVTKQLVNMGVFSE